MWLFVEERGRWVLDDVFSELKLPEPTPTPVLPTPDPATVPVHPSECDSEPFDRRLAVSIVIAAINGSLPFAPTPDDGFALTTEEPPSIEVAGTPWVEAGQLLDVPPSDPPHAMVEAEIRQSIRMLTACENAGDLMRRLGLNSERYLFLMSRDGDSDVDTWVARFQEEPTPQPEEAWAFATEVIDLRQLPNGRVAAIVVETGAESSMAGSARLLVFTQQRGIWVLDEQITGLQLSGSAAPPESGTLAGTAESGSRNPGTTTADATGTDSTPDA